MASDRIRILFFESGHLGGSIKSLSSLLRGLRELNCDLAFVSWYRETGPVDIFSLDFVERAHLRGARHLTVWETPLVKHVDRFIVLTKWGREFYGSEGIPGEKIHQLYNPIDLAAFDARLNQTPGFALEDGPIYAVQIGALKEPKRPGLAIEAVALAKAECPNLQLVLAGEGPARPALERLIVDKRLTGSVHLLGHCDQIPALLARCHIGLLVSRPEYEGMGNVILESMAARLPFITWDSPVMRELVVDGRTGIVAKDDSPAAIAEALVTLYQSRDLRNVMGAAGREWVSSDHFNPRSYVQAVRHVLEGVLERRR
jgi:glycosyltransferase involved in cell wall biosynthesis